MISTALLYLATIVGERSHRLVEDYHMDLMWSEATPTSGPSVGYHLAPTSFEALEESRILVSCSTKLEGFPRRPLTGAMRSGYKTSCSSLEVIVLHLIISQTLEAGTINTLQTLDSYNISILINRDASHRKYHRLHPSTISKRT